MSEPRRTWGEWVEDTFVWLACLGVFYLAVRIIASFTWGI
jgi:hypothetical protein